MLNLDTYVKGNSVKCGNIFIPSSAVETLCAHSVRKLIAKSPELDEYLSEAGSVTLTKYNGLRLAFLTSHQFFELNRSHPEKSVLESVLIPSMNADFFQNLPVKSFKYCTEDNDEEYLDIVAFEVDRSFDQVKKEECYFYSINNPKKYKIHQQFYVGYPRLEGNIGMDDLGRTEEIRMRCSIRSCSKDVNYRSDIEYFSKYNLSPSGYEMDGISGGAVFSLIETKEEPLEVILSGIIVRAGSEALYAIDVDFIQRMAASF